MKPGNYYSRGIALLTTLLVVSIVSIISISMIKRQRIDIQKTYNRQHLEQSWLYANGVDAWARGKLYKDGMSNLVDSEHDDWNQPIEPTAIEGGQIAATISDCQGKLNVNNLLANDNTGKTSLARLRRLFTILDVPQELVDRVIDWLDKNEEIHYPGGAEDSYYTGIVPAYRSANNAITDISELRLIYGFTDEIYHTVEPYLSALPVGVSINVNTASMYVLRSLGNITEQDAEAIIDTRAERPFTDIDSFLQHPALAGRKVTAEGLSVSSQYFSAESWVQIDYLKLAYRSILFRESADTIRIVRRARRGSFYE
jgi:general secretion pathway protein K